MFQRPVTGIFGEAQTIEDTPVFQLTAAYLSLIRTESVVGPSGATGARDSKFYVESGTAINGFAALVVKNPLIYRAGQGAKVRFTARFIAPQRNSQQLAGLLSSSDQLAFGYNGLDFGILYQRFGSVEIQELQVTTQAGGSEDATITVDDGVYTVPLTAGTVQHNAVEIAASLNSQVVAWAFQATDDTVVSHNLLTGTVSGAFAFSSATAIAAWSQIDAGGPFTTNFYTQAQWNVKPNRTVNAQKLVPYQIRYQYLGGGNIEFALENGETGRFDTVHKIKYPQTEDNPSLANPSMRLGLAVANLGNATNLYVESASLAAFIEGRLVNTEGSRGLSNTALAIGTTQTSILTIRNRIVFDSKVARTLIELNSVIGSSDSLKPVEINIYKNATFAAPLQYQYIDKDNSIVDYSTDQQAVTGGELILSSSTGIIDLEPLNLSLARADTLTVAMNVTQAPAAAMTASINWFELFS